LYLLQRNCVCHSRPKWTGQICLHVTQDLIVLVQLVLYVTQSKYTWQSQIFPSRSLRWNESQNNSYTKWKCRLGWRIRALKCNKTNYACLHKTERCRLQEMIRRLPAIPAFVYMHAYVYELWCACMDVISDLSKFGVYLYQKCASKLIIYKNMKT